MFTKISGSLNRQAKAFELLHSLLKEEFSLIMSQEVDKITGLEFSIHELLRQLANEKENVIELLGGGKVLDYAQMLPPHESKQLEVFYRQVDTAEQECARQASLNTEVSLALLAQGEQLIKELTRCITPKDPQSYGRKGAYTDACRPDAMLISGRL